MLDQIKLSNGAVLLCETVPGSEVAAVGFWFLHGSRDERTGEEGFSHFLEHMIFKGTGRRNARQIACEVDRLGGILNAATEKEVTSIYASVPKEHFGAVLDVICDIAFGATLPEIEIEKEKLVVENEISSIEDSPEEKGYELLVETVWRGHPLAARITGTAAAVRSIARGKLDGFYRRFFSPARLVISLAGGIDAAEAARALEARVAEYAGPSRAPAGPEGIPPRLAPPFLSGASVREDEFSQAQVYYARSFPHPARLKDYYEQLILSTAFGESMSSRLFQNIREEEGLCYSVYSSRSYYSDCAVFSVHASTLPEQLPALLAALDRELARLRDASLTADEIDEARLQVKGGLILSKQDAEVRMKRLARLYVSIGGIVSYEESYRVIDSVTAEDVRRLTDALFGTPASALLVFGCPGLEQVRPVIAGLKAFSS
jgi:predicted Zn-dependent peptidase